MRSLSDSLLAAQAELNLAPRIKITLSMDGYEDIVLKGGYPQQTGDRIIKIPHDDFPYSVRAKEIKLDNSDGYFTDLDLKGWKAVVAWGLTTDEGEEHSNTSPMWVVWQQFSAQPGNMTCYITLKGIPDLMDENEASEAYLPDDDDTKTVKTLIDAIAGATLACFNHCKAYTTVWETGYDAIVNTYKPKKSFRIYKGGSQLAALKRLIDHSQNVFVWKDDGTIHIKKSVSTGTNYDSEYYIDSGHPFLAKAYRHRLIIPNKVVVASEPDDDPSYSGSAQTSDYATLPDEVKKTKYVELTLESNAQAKSIAEAILARAEFNAEQGSALVSLNCGSELYDYAKVCALNADDVYRTGNIGWLSRTWDADKEEWSMTFGFGDPPGVANMRELYSALAKTAESQGGSFDRLYAKYAYIEDLWADFINIVDPESGQTVTLAADGIVILDHIDDGTTYGRLRTSQLSAGYIKLTSQSVKYGEWYDESGVLIDADTGIDLYGTDMAFTTSSAVGDITAFADAGGGEVKVTVIGHGLSTGDRVHISDTANYNGNYIITVVDADNFKITTAWVETETGTCRKVQTYTGTDGKFYAGGGAVKIGASGIDIPESPTAWFQVHKIAFYPTPATMVLYGSASGVVTLSGADLELLNDLLPHPTAGSTCGIGTSDRPWGKGYLSNRLKIPVGTDLYD